MSRFSKFFLPRILRDSLEFPSMKKNKTTQIMKFINHSPYDNIDPFKYHHTWRIAAISTKTSQRITNFSPNTKALLQCKAFLPKSVFIYKKFCHRRSISAHANILLAVLLCPFVRQGWAAKAFRNSRIDHNWKPSKSMSSCA